MKSTFCPLTSPYDTDVALLGLYIPSQIDVSAYPGILSAQDDLCSVLVELLLLFHDP